MVKLAHTHTHKLATNFLRPLEWILKMGVGLVVCLLGVDVLKILVDCLRSRQESRQKSNKDYRNSNFGVDAESIAKSCSDLIKDFAARLKEERKLETIRVLPINLPNETVKSKLRVMRNSDHELDMLLMPSESFSYDNIDDGINAATRGYQANDFYVFYLFSDHEPSAAPLIHHDSFIVPESLSTRFLITSNETKGVVHSLSEDSMVQMGINDDKATVLRPLKEYKEAISGAGVTFHKPAWYIRIERSLSS
ncbi:hypothetical protein FRC17_000979 [Serendipita sp. 399]|nr:hypothetical protein FRC17_000979 [Serendipita sp. 399]